MAGQSIGELFVKLGFVTDESGLTDFNSKLTSAADGIKNLSNIASLGVGKRIAEDIYGAVKSYGEYATAIKNLSLAYQELPENIQKASAAIRVGNPNASAGDGLSFASHLAKYVQDMEGGRAGKEYNQLTGNAARPKTAMELLANLRAGYAQYEAIDRQRGTNEAPRLLQEITGTPDAVNLMHMDEAKFQKAMASGVDNPYDLQKGVDVAESLQKLGIAADRLENQFLSIVAGPLTDAVNVFTDILEGIKKKGIVDGVIEGGSGGVIHNQKELDDRIMNVWNSRDKASLPLLASAGLLAGSSGLVHGGRAVMGLPEYDNDNKEARIKRALMAAGAKEFQADGIVANFKREGRYLNPDALGDHGLAYGLGQWHPDRQRDFAKFMGKPMEGSTIEEQAQFAWYEITKGNQRAAARGLLEHVTTAEEFNRGYRNNIERPLGAKPINYNITQNIHTNDSAMAAQIATEKQRDLINTHQQQLNLQNGTR
jgi:hypothetical protein